MTSSPWWQWVLVLGGVVLLAFAGISKRMEFSHVSRARGCVSNQNTIDKAVGVWESQNDDLPTDRELWIDVRSDGRIARVSPEVEEFRRRTPPRTPHALTAGSTVLLDYTKDPYIFHCPARYAHVRDELGVSNFEEVRKMTMEIHYRWISSPKPRPELGGRRRGAVCLLYGELGRREESFSAHAGEIRL